ncbi:hypothetical protein ANN_26176 [Periplaneta americana]|uniref:Ricin B lectin domain-containing protein n=1 Tax=Periplaneta americana TaxID=6978 RepID=A0ABQ8S5K5_PERAM|nr:hypothetical protein ANN_26176 [Periplaneta americana]
MNQERKRMTQKKILIMTVMEAYKLFKQKNVGIKLGKSKFAALRPQHVRPVSDKDLNVCCCRYHENADLLIGVIRKVWKKLPPDLDRLVSAVTCSEDISCYFGECDNCKDINNAIERYKDCETDNLDDTCVCYYQWNSTNHKELIQTTLFEAKEELLSQLPNLLRHCFTANIQLREIRHLKQTCCKNEAVLQEDFAENFAIRQQNEIMSAHWISEGVTIFTAIISRNGTTIPYAVISNELRHDKCSVFSFNKALLDHAGRDGDVISVLHVFSDGAGGQFKNRYTLSQCVLTPQELHKDLIYLDWSFFATAHGKGPIDGIGGTVKQAVWRRVLQGNVVISSAKEFYECAKHACPNINVLFLSSDDMSYDRTILSEKWNAAQPKPIPNLHKIHYVRASNPQVVAVSAISPFMDNISVSFTEVAMFDQPDSAMMEKNLHCKKKILTASTIQEFEIGNYVAVQYEGKKYPGIITEINKHMEQSQKEVKCEIPTLTDSSKTACQHKSTARKGPKPMMVHAATPTSSSDHLFEPSSQYAEWEENVMEQGRRKLVKLESHLFNFVYNYEHSNVGRKEKRLCACQNSTPPTLPHFQETSFVFESTRYNIIIGSAIENVALHNMKVAVEEAVAENDNVRGISAAFDGTWQKRGHISLNGVVTATSVDTGKNFILTWHKDIRPKGRTMCWDVSDVQNKAAVNLFPCHGMQGNQLWRYNPDYYVIYISMPVHYSLCVFVVVSV